MTQWQTLCNLDDLPADSGICALIDELQIALFYVAKMQTVFALHNYDPFAKAHVLSRGIIGDVNGDPVVASPIYKQHFKLTTGECIEDTSVKIASYPVRINNQHIEIKLTHG
ncbi:MAG: nitrite reductase small subunit NirD [Methylococcales bacterium]|nr:nitrite reductase small subunit NirD [Methylococcales bacterium]